MISVRRLTSAAGIAVAVLTIVLPGIALGQATRLAITGPASAVAGEPVSLTIEAYDGSGNIEASYTGGKTLTFSGAIASPNPPTNPTVSDSNGITISFGGPTVITFVNGRAEVNGDANGVMRLYRARSETIAATDGTISAAGADRLAITVLPSLLSKFTLGLNSPQLNGFPFSGSNTLTALDIYGNTVTTFDASADNVSISANSPLVGTVSGLGSGSNNTLNRASDFALGVANLTALGMRYTGTIGTGTFTAASVSGKSGTSGNVTISSGGATRLAITGSSSQIAGASQNITITAKDGAGNTVTGYSGTKNLTFSGAQSSTNPPTDPTVVDKDGAARGFGTNTSMTFVNGVATVSSGKNGVMTLYRAGTDSIAVSDGAITSTGADRLVVTVSAGAHAQFGITLASPQTNGLGFTGTNRIQAQDAWGNSVSSFNASTDNVTVVADDPLSGSIAGLGTLGQNVLNRSNDFVNGAADLTSLGMKYFGNAGTGTISVSSGSGKSGTSNAITITPGAATKLAFIQQPTDVEAGLPITPPVTVQVRDTSNNNITQAGVVVTMTLSSGTGVLSGTLSQTTNASGLATFSDLRISTQASKRLTASAAGLTPVASGNFTITSASAPTVTIWYGRRQTFRKTGIPQRWANILGNVTDPDGVVSLKYSLNGGPDVTLSMGPDTRRLADKGDFNVDLTWGQLRPSPDSNRVVITATDNLSNVTRDTVIVRYIPGTTWPLPYRVAWANDASLTDSAQVVDGLWSRDASGLLTVQVGYDRLVAMGDTTWTNYEATVPITVNEVDSSGYNPISTQPVVGFFLRWKGHTDDPVSGWQPKQGWKPFGAGAFFEFQKPRGKFMIYPPAGAGIEEPTGKRLQLGVPYYFKMRVETTPTGHLYKLKVWQVGLAEPTPYDVSYLAPLSGVGEGSFLLLAHHVKATFGAVVVTTITGDGVPPVISDLAAISGRTSAEIRWTTNEPAFGKVDYGLSTAYSSTVNKDSLASGQSILLTGLTENTLYHYRVTSTDASGNATVTSDKLFLTKGSSSITSDEFNSPTLNTALWVYVDPLGDGSQSMTGTQAALGVPAGTNHDAYTGGNKTPRIIQSATDTDFDIEVKFDAPLTTNSQGAGILVQADLTNYLRFDFFTDGTNIRAFAGKIVGDVGSSASNVNIGAANTAPLWMRIKRERNVWIQWYSTNGSTWTRATTFTHDLQVSAVGLFALNYGSPAPAYTAQFDYFRNAGTPRVRAAAKWMLEGPYDAASGFMKTTLKSSGALAARYPGRLIPAFAVDSVNIEIRNAPGSADATIRSYAPAWLLRDGTVRDFSDTTKTYVEFGEGGGDYYLVVHHATHLSAMSAGAVTLSTSSSSPYDFTGAISQAYGVLPMKQITVTGPPRFGLVAGNASVTNGIINAGDRQAVKAGQTLTGYRSADVNMDGVVNSQDTGLVRANTGYETNVP